MWRANLMFSEPLHSLCLPRSDGVVSKHAYHASSKLTTAELLILGMNPVPASGDRRNPSNSGQCEQASKPDLAHAVS